MVQSYVFQGFNSQLRDHLLSRLRGLGSDGDETVYSTFDRAKVVIDKDRIYMHPKLRVNYTTYDVQRGQDLISPMSFIIVISRDHSDGTTDRHPFWYARVLGIFHAEVGYLGPPGESVPKKVMCFVWVQWMTLQRGHKSGWAARRNPRVEFEKDGPSSSYGFLDPDEILRAGHMLPAYGHDHDHVVECLVNPFAPCDENKKLKQYSSYDVNMYVLL